MSRTVHTRMHLNQCLRLHTHRARAAVCRRRSGAVSAWTSVRCSLEAATAQKVVRKLSFRAL
jgi:hypothetical protein